MRKYAFVAVVLVLALASLVACGFWALRRLSAPTSSLRDLVEYIPPGVADYHPADLHGPSIHLADLDSIRRGLRLPHVTADDEPAARRSAVARLPLERFQLLPPELSGPVHDTYQEWGWDLNDVRQALFFHRFDTGVLVGDFRRPAIRERLAENGYSGTDASGFELFTAPSQPLIFALRDDALLYGKDEEVLRTLVAQKGMPRLGLVRHPAIAPLLPHLDGAWAAWLATSGDVQAMDRELLEMAPREALADVQAWYRDVGEEAWDLAAVVLHGPQDKPGLSILYDYPSQEEARRDVPLVERNLKEAPSIRYQGLTWGERVTVQSVKTQGSLVVARATMADPWNMFAAIRDRDVAWLPIRPQSSGSD